MSKSLPHSIEAEKMLLSFMVSSPEFLGQALQEVEADDFFNKRHELVFEGLKGLFSSGKDITLLTVSDSLKSKNSLDIAGGIPFLSDLFEAIVDRESFQDTLSIVKDKSKKRKLIQITAKISKESSDDSKPISDITDTLIRELWEMNVKGSSGIKVVSPGSIYEKRLEEIKRSQNFQPVRSYYKPLDDLVPTGFNKGEVQVIGARPGMGKSSFKSNLMVNQFKKGHCVVSFAVEQTFTNEQARLESILTGIPLGEILQAHRWVKGDWRIDEIRKANQFLDKECRYYIIPSRNVKVPDMRNILYQISQEGPIDQVYIDLFDKMPDVNVPESKAAVVGQKLGMAAQFAEEFNCAITPLVQIGRKVEQRKDKRPNMSDLKDSGSYEEVARLVILLYREKYYFPDTLNNDIEVIVAKQNSGPQGSVELAFNEETLIITAKDDFSAF